MILNVALIFVFQLVEPTVTLRVRQVDKGVVEAILGRAQNDYKEKIKKDVQLKVDAENYLAADTCGGIELIAAKGRIKVSLFSNSLFRKLMNWNVYNII